MTYMINGHEVKPHTVWKRRDGGSAIILEIEDSRIPFKTCISILPTTLGEFWFRADGTDCTSDEGEESPYDLIAPASDENRVEFRNFDPER